jgi:hypothetical protein
MSSLKAVVGPVGLEVRAELKPTQFSSLICQRNSQRLLDKKTPALGLVFFITR